MTIRKDVMHVIKRVLYMNKDGYDGRERLISDILPDIGGSY